MIIDPEKINFEEAAITGVATVELLVIGRYAENLISNTKVGQAVITKLDDIKPIMLFSHCNMTIITKELPI